MLNKLKLALILLLQISMFTLALPIFAESGLCPYCQHTAERKVYDTEMRVWVFIHYKGKYVCRQLAGHSAQRIKM